jgi:hypothetical protein
MDSGVWAPERIASLQTYRAQKTTSASSARSRARFAGVSGAFPAVLTGDTVAGRSEPRREEEDDGFWGMGAGTDRLASDVSGAEDDERDETVSPASRFRGRALLWLLGEVARALRRSKRSFSGGLDR